jgi:hypothetical protein
MMEPAKTVIEICGGVDAVAGMTGRDRSRVHRWAYPREKGGSNGLIPSDVAADLLRKAAHLGLKPDHFFILPQVAS